MPRYITPVNTYNLPAIMKAAWLRARHDVAAAAKTVGPFQGRVLPLRIAFAACLRSVWADAKSERCYALWAIEQDAGAAAEAARRAALPVRDREIEAASTALMFAEHSDAVNGHRLVAAARARLHSFQMAA